MKNIFIAIFLLGVFACSVQEEPKDRNIITLEGICTDLEKPMPSQDKRFYEVKAYIELFLKNGQLDSNQKISLLEGHYAMTPHSELPKISIKSITPSLLEKEKWIVPSVHVYGDSVYGEVIGQCELKKL
jgi:hypothetical protein